MAQWTIRTYQKKSCEQIEYFYNRKTKGKIIVRMGFRNAEFSLETNDDEFPDIEFAEVPGGDGKKDSIDLYSCFGSNVDETELIDMNDGGHWFDIEFEDVDEDEEERLRKLIEEDGSYALEDDGEGDWYLSDTEVWVWGPVEVTNEDGNSRVVCADEDGNMIDFEEDEE
jgi:hypothetical protein